jgi:amino acid adenylation domain-containing protein
VYLLFTSGSTGTPKGIQISHKNLNSYLDFVQNKYPLFQTDRCSQAFDTTFDPSQHDIWTTWSVGATLVVIPQVTLFNPSKFIIKKELTVWYSVPTVANMMRKMKSTKPNTFPLLRYSIFSGEALPADLAEDWQQAAPNSKLINYYGPTEVTINITDYLWNEKSKDISLNNITPLGKIFKTHIYKIVNADMKDVSFGSEGELIISGPQVAPGYYNDTEKTKQNFINLEDKVWYRTGDLVREDAENVIYFLGRIDHQIQIRGYRVELQEIESVVKEISKVNQVVAIPYPVQNNIAEGIVCFIEDEIDLNIAKVIQLAAEKLPDYMVPKAIFQIKKFPENINGKIDRKRLHTIIVEKYGTK